VKGVYGPDTDATAYLGKFVNFFFLLPKKMSFQVVNRGYAKAYVMHVFRRYKFDEGIDHDEFIGSMSSMVIAFNLSLRDIERAVALYAFAQPLNAARYLIAYVITIKLTKPGLLKRLVNQDIKAHEEAKDIVDALLQKYVDTDMDSYHLNIISEWHAAHINRFQTVGNYFQQSLNPNWRISRQPARLFAFLAEKIDLPMES
jgi:hypothetical protein